MGALMSKLQSPRQTSNHVWKRDDSHRIPHSQRQPTPNADAADARAMKNNRRVEIKSKGDAAGSLNICIRRSFFSSSESVVNLNEDEKL
jgi:hypothetical protein